mmetsp:Transcript_22693/g.68224  ORF Transcript_22693/g.68224 Transcript_22693/m.68224 type:complete len:229 (-) Transcript_22693:180-866(-)
MRQREDARGFQRRHAGIPDNPNAELAGRRLREETPRDGLRQDGRPRVAVPPLLGMCVEPDGAPADVRRLVVHILRIGASAGGAAVPGSLPPDGDEPQTRRPERRRILRVFLARHDCLDVDHQLDYGLAVGPAAIPHDALAVDLAFCRLFGVDDRVHGGVHGSVHKSRRLGQLAPRPRRQSCRDRLALSGDGHRHRVRDHEEPRRDDLRELRAGVDPLRRRGPAPRRLR